MYTFLTFLVCVGMYTFWGNTRHTVHMCTCRKSVRVGGLQECVVKLSGAVKLTGIGGIIASARDTGAGIKLSGISYTNNITRAIDAVNRTQWVHSIHSSARFEFQ